MIYLLCVKSGFRAKHYLPRHFYCGEEHEHDYRVEVKVHTTKTMDFVDRDFYKIQDALEDVLSEINGKNLNEIIDYPSAIEIAYYIYSRMAKHYPVYSVTVWESDDYKAVVK